MPPSWFRLAADVTVVLHVAFVAFVVLGGLLSLRWQWLMRLQIFGVAVPAQLLDALRQSARASRQCEISDA